MTVHIPVILTFSPTTTDRSRIIFPDDKDREYVRQRMWGKSLELVDVRTSPQVHMNKLATLRMRPGAGATLQDAQGCIELRDTQSDDDQHLQLRNILCSAGRRTTTRPGVKIKAILSFCTSENTVFLLMPRVKDIEVYEGRTKTTIKAAKAANEAVMAKKIDDETSDDIAEAMTADEAKAVAERVLASMTETRPATKNFRDYASFKDLRDFMEETVNISRRLDMTDDMLKLVLLEALAK